MVNGHGNLGENPVPGGADVLLPSSQILFLALAALNSPVPLLVMCAAAANASGSSSTRS